MRLIDYVKSNPSYKWAWIYLSENKQISITEIFNNMDLPWKREHVSMRDDLTIDFVLNNMNYPWCWYQLSKNKAISFTDISNNKGFHGNGDLYH